MRESVKSARALKPSVHVDQYASYLKDRIIGKMTFDSYNRIVQGHPEIRSIDDRLRESGVKLGVVEGIDAVSYELTLPCNLMELNRILSVPEDEIFEDDDELYFPPEKVIQYLDKSSLRAGVITIKSIGDSHTAVGCEHFGHALGFLRAYLK